MKEVYVHF